MLARKIGYMDYQTSRAISRHRTIAHTQSQSEERRYVSQVLKILFAVLVVVVVVMAGITVTAITTNYGYSLMQEKQQVRQLHQDNEILRLDIAKMESPDRIYTMATQKLGMVAPTQVLYGPSYTNSSVGEHTGK